MLCLFLLHSKVTQLYSILHILFHYDLSQDIEYSPLCYTVGPCSLSVIYIVVTSASPKLPIQPSSAHPSSRNHESVLYVCESVSVS